MSNVLSQARQIVDQKNIEVISLDIFDTILLRNTKPEQLRFYEVAEHQAKLLQKICETPLDQKLLYHARADAHRMAYRLAPWRDGQRDASIELVIRLMLANLNLPLDEDLIAKLYECELSYEKENLFLNRALFDFVKEFNEKGGKVLLISDMYFLQNHLEDLVGHFIPNKVWQKIYVSSEYSQAKHSGGLYDIALREETLTPSSILHIGDNFHSDVSRAKEKGLHAIHAPRSKGFLRTRGLREYWFNARSLSLR